MRLGRRDAFYDGHLAIPEESYLRIVLWFQLLRACFSLALFAR